MNLNNLEIDIPIYINEYECLSGLDVTKLTNSLKSLSSTIIKRDITKVGIIIDQDNFTKEERCKFVNECINNVFQLSSSIDDVGYLIDVTTKNDDIPVKMGCYFTQKERFFIKKLQYLI